MVVPTVLRLRSCAKTSKTPGEAEASMREARRVISVAWFERKKKITTGPPTAAQIQICLNWRHFQPMRCSVPVGLMSPRLHKPPKQPVRKPLWSLPLVKFNRPLWGQWVEMRNSTVSTLAHTRRGQMGLAPGNRIERLVSLFSVGGCHSWFKLLVAPCLSRVPAVSLQVGCGPR